MSEITITWLSWGGFPLLKLKKVTGRQRRKKKTARKSQKNKFKNLKLPVSFFQKQSQLHEEKVKFFFCDISNICFPIWWKIVRVTIFFPFSAFTMIAATSTQCSVLACICELRSYCCDRKIIVFF